VIPLQACNARQIAERSRYASLRSYQALERQTFLEIGPRSSVVAKAKGYMT